MSSSGSVRYRVRALIGALTSPSCTVRWPRCHGRAGSRCERCREGWNGAEGVSLTDRGRRVLEGWLVEATQDRDEFFVKARLAREYGAPDPSSGRITTAHI